MRMNNTCYKQYDTRWSGLPYPRKPWYIRNCGCGEVAICNAIIEMATQAGQTPKSIQPYMKQYAESRGNGTFHYGIPAAMKHYGLTEVAEHSTMQKLWNELKKGGRIAILLMGKRNAGSKGVHWTGSGHYVAVTGYKEEGGKHWVYVKDSASTSSLRNGWITYEGNIRNACLKCWSGKLNGEAAKAPTPTVTPTADGKLTIDGVGGPSTVKAMQRFFGTPQDGIISGQNQSCAKWYPALKSVKYGKGGSPCIRNLQRWVGVTIDGVWGKNTSKALQKKLGVKEDCIFGAGSMKAWQKYLNEHDKADYPPTPAPAPTPTPKPSGGTYIGQACSDKDKKAGDSSGGEVCKSKFKYSTSSSSCFNWTFVFRPKDSAKANKAASMCEKAIANNHIGYSKRGETAYGKDKAMSKLAKAVNYDLSKINTKCGLSCGDLVCLCNRWAGLSTCYIGSGLQLANKLKQNSNFECIPYKKGMTLKRGDTIITAHANGKNNHVAMVL